VTKTKEIETERERGEGRKEAEILEREVVPLLLLHIIQHNQKNRYEMALLEEERRYASIKISQCEEDERDRDTQKRERGRGRGHRAAVFTSYSTTKKTVTKWRC
jgi:hypothetical protein